MARNTVVPAQVMTVEDKIIGGLGMKQLILLGIGLLGSGGIFLGMAPTNKLSVLKLLIIIALNVVATGGAIRFKGDLLLRWAAVAITYMLRPRHWVYDKNTLYLRPVEKTVATEEEKAVQAQMQKIVAAPVPAVDIPTQVEVEKFMSNPGRRVRFINTKGGLKIVFTEAE